MTLEYIDTVELPAYALSYLINGEASGLEDSDITDIDQWVDSLDYDCLVFDYDDDSESGFTSCPEFGLPCDCIETRLYGHPKS